MVEFALVFGVLMMLVLGIFVFARAYNVYQTVTRAAREGARMAAMPTAYGSGGKYLDQGNLPISQSGQMCQPGSWPAQGSQPNNWTAPTNSAAFNNYIAPVLQSSSLDPCHVTNYSEQVALLDPNGTVGNQCGVVISFQYPYVLSIPFLPSLAANAINITANVQMRIEGQPSTATLSACQTEYP